MDENELVTPPSNLPNMPMQVEAPMVSPRPPRRMASILGGVAAVLLVIGVATASYLVSNRLRSQTALAPTAPESEPLAANCEEGVRDDPIARDSSGRTHLTFERAGTIRVFTNNIDVDGGLQIAVFREVQGFLQRIWYYATPAPVEPEPPRSPYAIPTTFNVNAGDVLRVSVMTGGSTAYGWKARKADTVCGPTDNTCGLDKDISALKTMVDGAGVDLTGINAGSPQINAGYQCWGDHLWGDPNQDYDFNDFAVVFGYDNPGAPTPTIPGRPDYCQSASVDNKTSFRPGETITLRSTSKEPVNEFHYYAYNLDNPRNGNPNDPWPVCVGNEPATPDICPNGGHHLSFSEVVSTRKLSGSVSIPYNEVFVSDRSWLNLRVGRVKFNAYFKVTDGELSLPNEACMVRIEAERPDACVNTNVSKEYLTAGETETFTSTSNPQMNAFFYYIYNLDHIDPVKGPTPLCIGNDLPSVWCAIDPQSTMCACPDGGHHLFFQDSRNRDYGNLNLRTDGQATAGYSNVFAQDKTWDNTIPSQVQVRGYFRLNGGPISLPQPACTTTIISGTPPTPTPSEPTPSEPTPSEPTPTPVLQCVASSMFMQVNGQWTAVTYPDLVRAGTNVRFGVRGNPASAVAKAQFKINGGNWIESTNTMTAVDGRSYFYVDHVLGSGSYNVKSQILRKTP